MNLAAGHPYMVDFALARRAMIDSQVATSAVTDRRLLSAMGRVPREIFVAAHRRDLAYLDDHQPLGAGRFLAAPAVFARLVQLAAIRETDTVLDVGAATGYSAAILSALARQVTAVEPDTALAAEASANLSNLSIGNVAVVPDIPADESFDAIIVEGAIDSKPDALLARLRRGGRLVALIRRGGVGVATRFVAEGNGFKNESHFDATLPPLYTEAKADEFIF